MFKNYCCVVLFAFTGFIAVPKTSIRFVSQSLGCTLDTSPKHACQGLWHISFQENS